MKHIQPFQNATTFEAVRLKALQAYRSSIEGTLRGNLGGEGAELSHLRPYRPGDDIRKISWNTLAKRGEIFVKETLKEERFLLHVDIYLEGTLYFAEGKEKLSLLVETFLVLGYAALKAGAFFQAHLFMGEKRFDLERTRHLKQIERFAYMAYQSEPLHQSVDPSTTVATLTQRVPIEAKLFLLGDFSQTFDMSLLRPYKDATLLVMRHRLEAQRFPPAQRNLHHPVTGKEKSRFIDMRLLRGYGKKRADFDKKEQAKALRNGVNYIPLFTGELAAIALARKLR